MQKRTLSAKKFTLPSYSEDIFDGFGIDADKTVDATTLPASARSARIATPALPIKDKAILKTKNNGVSSVAAANIPAANPGSQHHSRPKVPHDFSSENYHDRYCKSFKLSMLTYATSYHPRRHGLLGKTNRLSYLRKFDDNDLESVSHDYPPSYHGTEGESKSLALGLTVAGCPSSFSRTLHAPTSFGQEKILNRSGNINPQDILKIPPRNVPLSSAPKLQEDNASRAASSFYDVLNISRSNITKVRPIPVPAADYSTNMFIPTRYSANSEWTRPPTHALIQPVESSASFSPESERLSSRGYIDTQNIRERNRQAAKLKKISHRNAVSVK